MKILVTGGAGYIGAVFAHTAKDAGFEVVILDDFSTGHREPISGFRILELDIRDAHKVKNVFREHFDAIFHFAARSIVSEAQRYPDLYESVNVEGTRNLLTAMVEQEQKPLFVFSSTAAVYGETRQSMLIENADCRPSSVYGRTKREAEKVLVQYTNENKLKSVIFRYFNVGGAQPERLLGEAHFPETHLIPRIIQSVSGGQTEFEVFGQDHPTFDGTCVRDYIHVVDVARAHLAALSYFMRMRDGSCEVFNIGSAKGYSVLDILEVCRNVLSVDIKAKFAPPRRGDVASLVANVEKAEKMLKFCPEFGIHEIVSSAKEWESVRRY